MFKGTEDAGPLLIKIGNADLSASETVMSTVCEKTPTAHKAIATNSFRLRTLETEFSILRKNTIKIRTLGLDQDFSTPSKCLSDQYTHMTT